MELNKISSIDLANYILAKTENVDHLKLQKLIYYVEAWHLAYFNESVIDDEFEAWVHGPVSRNIWDGFKGSSVLYTYIEPSKSLKEVEAILKEKVNESQLDLINEVLGTYGAYSSFELEEYTHGELPWQEARQELRPNESSEKIIDKNTMAKFYRDIGWETE